MRPSRSRPRRSPGPACAAWLALALAAACAAPAPLPAPEATPKTVGRSDLAPALVALGEQALAAGHAEAARERFERALAAAPGSARARAGLGRALAAAGRDAEARAALEAALAQDPRSAAAHLGLAELEARAGRPESARDELEAALRIDPFALEAHARLATATGPAPATPAASLDEAQVRARAHPYDPRALLAAGEGLLAAGDAARARAPLERVLGVADLDPPSARRAVALLRERVPAWAEREVVWVHVWADELLRAAPTWPFQARAAFAGLSQALGGLLGTRFVPISLNAFVSDGAGFDLQPIRAAFERQQPLVPADGIVAVLTGRALPPARGTWQRGQADFLGRILVARMEPGEVSSRVLAHELLHLYGAMHVAPDAQSIMSPGALTETLDPWNAAIVRALRGRRFGPGGVERNVVPHVDLAAAIAAYRSALGANLALRQAGVVAALEASGGSPRIAAHELRAATGLDQHLGDVASFVAELLVHDARPAAAAALLDAASQLYGPRSKRGARAAQRARALEARAGAS